MHEQIFTFQIFEILSHYDLAEDKRECIFKLWLFLDFDLSIFYGNKIAHLIRKK